MANIISAADLPTAIQSHELVGAMVAGANAKASRVAPCLIDPTSAAWAATTAYVVAAKVRIAASQFLEVTIAGTSGAVAPAVPADVGGSPSRVKAALSCRRTATCEPRAQPVTSTAHC